MIPESGSIYLDASPIIYAIEKIEPYAQILSPLWRSVAEGNVQIFGSELLLLETLVKPRQVGDIEVESLFRQFFASKEIVLTPISTAVLEEAISLRSDVKLRTPDAIHAASSLLVECDFFLTNDKAFRKVPALNVVVLDGLLP